MVNIQAGKNSGTFVDVVFSRGVGLVQSTAVRTSVMLTTKKKGVKQRETFATSGAYNNRMRDLGLKPERLWWGPMTIAPRKVQFLLNEIESRAPKRLLEVGSGTSTAIFAAAGEKFGFDVLSLENHQATIDYVQMLLHELPCSRRVTIQKCNFVRRSYATGEKYRWYDADLTTAGAQFDFVFIDGPMGRLVGRNGALPEIMPYVCVEHRIYLDDSNRAHERACIEEWRIHFPNLVVERPPEGRGVARMKVANRDRE